MNTESTRRNVGLNNLHLEPHDYRIYHVNINLLHQYGIYVAKSQTFRSSSRNVPSGEERGGTTVFVGYYGP